MPGKKAPNQKVRLLIQYREAGEHGLTDEEAAVAAGISYRSSFWKRCNELRDDYLIERHAVPQTRKGSAGVDRIVCVISEGGKAYLKAYLKALEL